MKRNINEYDLLRVIVTILVVVGHSFFLKLSYGDLGGLDYTNSIPSESFSLVNKLGNYIVGIIYMFHMPLFMALSGALFYISLKKNEKWSIFVKKKITRLIVPFVAVTLFYSIPIKYATGYFGDDWTLSKIFVGQILMLGGTHLWFIVALFFIFLMALLCEKKLTGGGKIILLIVFYFLGLKIESIFNILSLGSAFKYLIFFYMGFYFEKNRSYINSIAMNNKMLFFTFSTLALLGVLIMRFMMGFSSFILCSIPCMFWIYLCCLFVTNGTYIMESKAVCILKKYSYDIYLYSEAINYILLFIAFRTYSTHIVTDNTISFSLISIRVITTLLIPIVLGFFLQTRLKVKIKFLNRS